MGKKDSRIDAYIAKSADFAKPILNHLRGLVHKACPEVEETIKWSFACFDYKGIFCSMAAFKQHATFGFWKQSLMNDPEGYLKECAANGGEAMGSLGRITNMKDLPPDRVVIGLIRQAKKLNDDNIKLPPRKKTEKKDIIVPDYFTTALGKNKKALQVFEAFSPSHKKEYLEWVTEAKTEDTRNRRMATAIEWIAEGKGRNWKYERK